MDVATIESTPQTLAWQIKQQARSLGFDLVGIAPALPSARRDYFRKWLDEGRAGEMQWLSRRFDERTDPSNYLPGAKSVISVAVNYHVPLEEPVEAAPSGRIARYALGGDYHETIKDRLHDLADWLREIVPEAQTKCGVDTAPIMEKELAARAGIGWIGKHTLVINPKIGSWILLGQIITTLELPADAPATDHCGACRRCLDACPTGAITAPYELDARKCIAYLTIENPTDVPADLASKTGDWIFGCDVCQEVCPWNSRAVDATAPWLAPRFPAGRLALDDVLSWDQQTYYDRLRHSAMRRVKLPVLQRNAATARANGAGKP